MNDKKELKNWRDRTSNMKELTWRDRKSEEEEKKKYKY